MAERRQQAVGGDDGSFPKPQPDQPCSDQGDESTGTSSVFSSHQARPLFGSLEEAHSRITRPQPSGTPNSIGNETTSSGSGVDIILRDMHRLSTSNARANYTTSSQPKSRAFGRSASAAVHSAVDEPALLPSPLLVQKQPVLEPQEKNGLTAHPTSKTAPAAWQNADEPSRTPPTRFTEAQAYAEAYASNQPPPYSPKGKLDRTIAGRGQTPQTSSAVDFKFRPLPSSVDGDRANKEDGEHKVLSLVYEGGIGSPPQVALPEDPPFHPSNPFGTSARLKAFETVLRVVNASPAPDSPSLEPPPRYGDNDDGRARFGSDLEAGGAGIGVDSDFGARSDENKVPKMLPPPSRMHSARRRERRTDSLISSCRSSLFGGGMTEGSEEDPFHYDSVFLRPSREREVSAYLHKVSGVERGSAAVICSPDGSLLKPTSDSLDKGPSSPEVNQMVPDDQVSPLRLPQLAAVGNDAQSQKGQDFFEPSVINPEWTVGSPDVVRVPVRGRARFYQRRNAKGGDAGVEGTTPKLVLEGLRGCEKQGQLPTGNTEG